MIKPPRIAPRIVCATDFSPKSERAFCHALAIAMSQRAHLTMLHIGPESREEVPWDRYHSVRNRLLQWGVIAQDTQRDELEAATGMAIKKMAMRDQDPFHGIADYLRERNIDMLVMAAGQVGNAGRLHFSLAQRVILHTYSRGLLLPEDTASLIDPATGRRLVSRVLFIYDHEPDPRSALPWLNESLPHFGESPVEVRMLYIGLEKNAPEITLPEHPRLKWTLDYRNGKQLDTIQSYIDEYAPELLIMMNPKLRGLIRRLRGSITGKVLRRAKLPMLLIPEEHS